MLNRFENINCGMFFNEKKYKTYFEDEKYKWWLLVIKDKQKIQVKYGKLIYYMLIEGILENSTNNSFINGISIGPKINNCIFKIWNSEYKKFNNSCLRNDIDIFINNDLFYLEHKKIVIH